jgi:hypothetical protein
VSLTVLGEPDSGLSMTAALLSVAAQVALLAALLPFARQIAARGGGWRAGLGLDRIRRTDWLPSVLGLALVFLGRLMLGVVLPTRTPSTAGYSPRSEACRSTGSPRPRCGGGTPRRAQPPARQRPGRPMPSSTPSWPRPLQTTRSPGILPDQGCGPGPQ